jgi:hypothetical protein
MNYADANALAAHEIGHVLVAKRLFDPLAIAITTRGAGMAITSRPENFQHSLALDLAGFVAQALRGASTTSYPVPTPINAENLEQWVRDIFKLFPNPDPGHDLFLSKRLPIQEVVSAAGLAFHIISDETVELIDQIKAQLATAESQVVSDDQAIRRFIADTKRQRVEAANEQYKKREAEILAQTL